MKSKEYVTADFGDARVRFKWFFLHRTTELRSSPDKACGRQCQIDHYCAFGKWVVERCSLVYEEVGTSRKWERVFVVTDKLSLELALRKVLRQTGNVLVYKKKNIIERVDALEALADLSFTDWCAKFSFD